MRKTSLTPRGNVRFWQSGHLKHSAECPLLGVKRTWQLDGVMSAFRLTDLQEAKATDRVQRNETLNGLIGRRDVLVFTLRGDAAPFFLSLACV